MATATRTTPLDEPDDLYPESDGKPMAETGVHVEAMVDLIVTLQDRFAPDPDVRVLGNIFLYFGEGDPTRVVSPDVMVLHGVGRDRNFRTFKTWAEGGITPALVVELSSKSTRREDLRHEFLVYRDDLRVREYIVFDPLHEYLKPRLQGFRLDGEDYYAIDPVEGRLPSEVIGLDLVAVGKTLRLFDPTHGRIIPNRLELIAEADRMNREQAAELADREMTIREQEVTIAQKDLALERAESERERLLAEIARLQARDRAD